MQMDWIGVRKVRKTNMYIFIGIVMILAGIVLIWFHIPYSPLKKEFQNTIDRLIKENNVDSQGDFISKEDVSHLPNSLQKYFESCGYIGTPKTSYLRVKFEDVILKQGKNAPDLVIDYTQYDFIKEPSRMALIDSSLYGIPFQGCDYYQNGNGGMKGVVGKIVTLFHQKGLDMDKACLVTFLAEAMMAPEILLQDYVTFEEISDYEVKVTITHAGKSVSGIFTLNQEYEMVSFTTKERAAVEADGTVRYVPWTALCGEYEKGRKGIKFPMKLQAIWEYPEGDLLYFDGVAREVSSGF